MDNLSEIKKKLYILYMEYKDNNSKLSSEKTKSAAKLIVDMSFSKEANLCDVATELARFSADIVKNYFDTLTQIGNIPIELLDEILKEFLLTDKDTSKSQYYVQKFFFTISAIMKNYKDKAIDSTQLPRLVVFIARYAVKFDRSKMKFQQLINETTGGIYMLDYSGIERNLLVNIWNATNSIFPDLSKARYESFIVEWGKKYGFIKDIKEYEKVKNNASDDDNKTASTENLDKAKVNADNETDYVSENNKSADSTNAFLEILTQKLYGSLKKDISEQHDYIISAVTELIRPISRDIDFIKGEISENRKISVENDDFKAKTKELEHQVSSQRIHIQETDQTISLLKAENNDLKNQITELESKNAELDSKLSEAYAINSRESSLEAEKVRSDLKKSFSFLYEDWLEYEFSDVSEENYESLQAIIKKVFRSLERNGIDFKGNNE